MHYSPRHVRGGTLSYRLVLFTSLTLLLLPDTVGFSSPCVHLFNTNKRQSYGSLKEAYAFGSKLPATQSYDEGSTPEDERAMGLLVLLSVPMAWGTFEPAVRFVYELDPPIPGFVFSVCYYLVAALSLSLLASISRSPSDQPDTNSMAEGGLLPLPARGGIELGSYLFVGNALQVLGLQTVASDRAAFLLQLTTIFVPIVNGIAKRNLSFISLNQWMACVIALVGVATMNLDGESQVSVASFLGSFSRLSQGDGFVILAALMYTFHCLRLEKYAKETRALDLGASKATTETMLSSLLVLVLVSVGKHLEIPGGASGLVQYAHDTGRDIFDYLPLTMNTINDVNAIDWATIGPALGAVLWTGLITCGYTITAQSFGQSRVDPITANLIYTIQPIFTSVFAWLLLGESLGPAGYAGGALIGSAVYLAIDDSRQDRDKQADSMGNQS